MPDGKAKQHADRNGSDDDQETRAFGLAPRGVHDRWRDDQAAVADDLAGAKPYPMTKSG
jgi:surface antigen